MNIDTCETKTTFGQTIERDTPVRITIRKTGQTLEAKAAHRISSEAAHGGFRIDGLSDSNTFYARDIDVEAILPPIEPGFYLNRYGVIFRMTGDPKARPRVAHLSRMEREVNMSDTTFSYERDYHKEIREGKTVRIANLAGEPVSA